MIDMAGEVTLAARGLTDSDDRLLSADQPLAELQIRCGGSIPGTLAIPELLDLVRQGRRMGLRLAREFSAFDGQSTVSGFVRINPLSGEEEGAVCELLVENWQRETPPAEDEREAIARIDAIDRGTAELSARLDADQAVQAVESSAPDLVSLVQAMRSNPGKLWSSHVELSDMTYHQPLHWRLLDGIVCKVQGSPRSWRVRLLPVGGGSSAPSGFELLLIADHPFSSSSTEDQGNVTGSGVVGEALTPALQQPIARIIANAETIRSRLAGPLKKEYSDYAGDIANAGQHLSALLDDLGDLEVVEAPGFSAARERVELQDVAERAIGILRAKAREKLISIEVQEDKRKQVAIAEFRRVLQILLNLIGNAISYSPNESTITISFPSGKKDEVHISVADNGPGMTEDQQHRVFQKFERLGRGGDGGSGLGLYISQRLATAMNGILSVSGKEGEGTTFTLTLLKAS